NEEIAERAEQARVLREIEALHEARGRVADALQHPGDPGTEEVHPAVGHAGGEESHQLDVGGIAVAGGKLDRVLLDTGGPVELATELVEGLLASTRGPRPLA